ncbi:MAG: hypothetical protein LUG60_11790 [Erysipelotrichaceae bacterium]|nr:hypothetical protein [Erysipelotrichaceae bacterium]
MQVQNTIADELDKKTEFDEQCKKILSDPQILAYIVKNCVDECQNISTNYLIQYFKDNPPQTGSEDISISGTKIIYDILVSMDASILGIQDKVGLIINIEPQKTRNLHYHLERRCIHNNCRLIAQQKGVDFIHSNYNDLKKVYSIWIVYKHAKMDDGVIGKISYDYKETGRNYSKGMLNFIKKRIKKIKSYIDLSDIILIYPYSEYHENKKSINNFFSLLFTDSKTPNEKKLLFEDKYDIIMTDKQIEEVDYMCKMSDYIIDRSKLEDARIVMDKLSYTIEQALDFLEIEEDRPWFIDQLTDYETI